MGIIKRYREAAGRYLDSREPDADALAAPEPDVDLLALDAALARLAEQDLLLSLIHISEPTRPY